MEHKHIISVAVENKFGVLARIAGLFGARGFNIDSLTVGETEDPSISKMTIVVSGDDDIIEQVCKQLNKLIDIIKSIPNKVRLNIAAKINNPDTNILVSELKDYCQLTDYSEKKIIALNIDSSKCLIGVFNGEKVMSIYSEILGIIEIFNPTIMEPFIRGLRV